MRKKIFSVGAVLILLVLLAAAVLFLANGDKKESAGGDIIIDVSVTTGALSESHSVKTSCKYLGDALLEAGLIKGEKGQYGLFITEAAGIKADTSKEEWWCITRGGESVNEGVSSIEIKNGDKYELTLKTGY